MTASVSNLRSSSERPHRPNPWWRNTQHDSQLGTVADSVPPDPTAVEYIEILVVGDRGDMETWESEARPVQSHTNGRQTGGWFGRSVDLTFTAMCYDDRQTVDVSRAVPITSGGTTCKGG